MCNETTTRLYVSMKTKGPSGAFDKACHLSFPQTFRRRPLYRTGNKLDDAALAGFDFSREVHAGTEVDGLTVDIHPRLVQPQRHHEDGALLFVLNGILRDFFHRGV